MKQISIWTDGSCSGNPGPGGYAAIIRLGEEDLEVCGFSADARTTNNRMELTAVLQAVLKLSEMKKGPFKAIVHTDSQYLCSCVSHRKVNWFAEEGRKNQDLWMELIQACKKGGHKVTFVKVKGHDGLDLNERADKLAKACCRKACHKLAGTLKEEI